MAFDVAFSDEATARLEAGGSRNARLETPDGLQLTLFTEPG